MDFARLVFRRGMQSGVHPQKFTRLLKLTDGSTLHVLTLTPPPMMDASQPSVSRLNLDSANHPSWNPVLRDRILLDDRGKVAKFRARFADAQTAFAEEFTDDSDAVFAAHDPAAVSKVAGTKTKTRIDAKKKGKK